MSRVFLMLSVVLYCLVCYQAKAGNSTNGDSLLTEAIINYDYSKFVGKTLGEFLSTNPIANYKKRRYYEAKIGVLKGLRLTYAKNLVVIPVIKNFSHVKPYKKERDWDYDAIYKEVIYEFRVIYINDEFWVSPDVNDSLSRENRAELLKIFRTKCKSSGKTRRYDTM